MKNILNFSYLIIAFSISLSQFYFLGSGNAQITHYSLVLFLGFIFLLKIKDEIFYDKKIIILIALLLAYFFLVNSFVYFIRVNKIKFAFSWYTFPNFMVIMFDDVKSNMRYFYFHTTKF